MLRITSIEPQKTLRLRSGRRFNIFLDGIFAFSADEDLIVEYRLTMGKEIDKPQLEKLLFEAEVGKLMERMYRLFSIRQRSEREVRNYFRVKNAELKIKDKESVSDLAIDLLIQKLKQKGLINDEQFAKAWVEARRKSKNKGKIALQTELFQKGIDRETIANLLAEQTAAGEQALAQQALEKKLKSWKSLPILEFKKKAYAFLLRRGFEYSIVREIVEKISKKIYNMDAWDEGSD